MPNSFLFHSFSVCFFFPRKIVPSQCKGFWMCGKEPQMIVTFWYPFTPLWSSLPYSIELTCVTNSLSEYGRVIGARTWNHCKLFFRLRDFLICRKSATTTWGCSHSHEESHVAKNWSLLSSNTTKVGQFGSRYSSISQYLNATPKKIPNQNHSTNLPLMSWIRKPRI